MKNDWPVKAQALGGRHYKTNSSGEPYVDQNFDAYSVEYTFADGAKLYMDGRCMNGCNDIYSSYAHGSKGMAVVAASSDCQPPSRTFKGQVTSRPNMIWQSKNEGNPYDNEWLDLWDAIRNNKPYSEVEYGVKASVTSSLGRFAAHTGQEVTFEDFLNNDHEYAPGVDQFTMESPAPLQANKDGKYPQPMPGINRKREF
jgi:hypothetical protein